MSIYDGMNESQTVREWVKFSLYVEEAFLYKFW